MAGRIRAEYPRGQGIDVGSPGGLRWWGTALPTDVVIRRRNIFPEGQLLTGSAQLSNSSSRASGVVACS